MEIDGKTLTDGKMPQNSADLFIDERQDLAYPYSWQFYAWSGNFKVSIKNKTKI